MRLAYLVLGFAFLVVAVAWAALAVLGASGLAWVAAALFLSLSIGWFLLFVWFDKTPAGRREAAKRAA